MGRWSGRIAPRFLDWLDIPEGLDWLEVGCGTGALSAAILAQGRPTSLVALDPSEGFVALARSRVPDKRAEFRVGDAHALTLETDSRDAIVSALVLNFVPDKAKALAEMKRDPAHGAGMGGQGVGRLKRARRLLLASLRSTAVPDSQLRSMETERACIRRSSPIS